MTVANVEPTLYSILYARLVFNHFVPPVLNGLDEKGQHYLRVALTSALEIEAWSLVLDILVSFIEAQATHLTPEETCEILSIIHEHPASEKQTKDRAEWALNVLDGVP